MYTAVNYRMLEFKSNGNKMPAAAKCCRCGSGLTYATAYCSVYSSMSAKQAKLNNKQVATATLGQLASSPCMDCSIAFTRWRPYVLHLLHGSLANTGQQLKTPSQSVEMFLRGSQS